MGTPVGTPPRGVETKFLRKLAEYDGVCDRQQLGPQMSQDENRARQLCRRRGWAYWDGYYWRLTADGRAALARDAMTPALAEPTRDKRDAALDAVRDALWKIWYATSVPAHKRTDIEFLRGTVLVANEHAHHAMKRVEELLK